MSVFVITPWLGMPHLLPAYAAATEGAIPILVDTGSDAATVLALKALAYDRGGVYIRHEAAVFSYGAACNAGINAALQQGPGVVVCLNNDVEGSPDWVADAERMEVGVLAGPEVINIRTLSQPHIYVAGWCVAARLETWQRTGGWDDRALTGSYHEDVDLSWRAARLGIYARRTPWALRHLGEQTTRVTPGATDHHAHNRAVFEGRVRAWLERGQA